MTHNEIFWALHAPMAAQVLESLALKQDFQAEELRPAYVQADNIAIINISGPIVREAWYWEEGQDRIRANITKAMSDPAVKAIMLSFDSPGGVVSGTSELASFIAKCAKKKPMAAYANGLCASAAYWLAAATSRVYAPSTAQIGSIGVLAVLTNLEKMAEEEGVKKTVLYSGKWKAAGNPFKNLTPEEKDYFQNQLAEIHNIFSADVAKFMKLEGDQWADGRIFLGMEAQKMGLVTRVVEDEAAAISLLASKIKEKPMDLGQLKAEHADLVAELEQEFKAKLQSSEKDESSIRKETLAFVSALAGQEIAAKVEKLMSLGVTAEQYTAMAALMPQAQKVSAEAETRAQMLEAIQNAQSQPVPGQIGAEISPLVADAQKRSCK